MKIKEGFILRDVAGQTVVLPTGDELDLNLMITVIFQMYLWSI